MIVTGIVRKTLLLLAGLGCLGFQAAQGADVETIFGRAGKVVDGDTLWVDGVKVRLNGVDAPELETDQGLAARLAMLEIVGDHGLRCELNGDTSHDRKVGVCFLTHGPEAGMDIGSLLVAAGLALDCPRFSGGRYAAVERPAARAKLPAAPYCDD
jgi:endonuclease YncB( thermonuclease family)